MNNDIQIQPSVIKEEVVDPVEGVEGIQSNDPETIDKSSTILKKLKKAMRLGNNQWANLAIDMMVNKLIMDYKYLVYVKYEDQLKGSKQNLELIYEIGNLVNDFIDMRRKDLTKKDFQRDRIAFFPANRVIKILTDLIDYASSNRQIRFNKTYLRNFVSIANNFTYDELDSDIPVYIYKEVVERIPQNMFSTERARKKFQRDILKIRKEITFTDRHVRIAIALVREDLENRANLGFLRSILNNLKSIPSKTSFEDGLSMAKSYI